MDTAASDAVHRVAGIAVPRRKKKATFAFTARLIKGCHERRQFITNQQHTSRTVAKNFM